MTEPDDEGFAQERWVFLGEYEGQTTKRVAGYRDEHGAELHYKWSSTHGSKVVGHIYAVAVRRIDDSVTAKLGSMTWTGEKPEDSEEIRMQARVRDQMREDKLAEERARKSDPELQALLDHVEQYAAKFTKTTSREALLTLIKRSVWSARRKS